MRSCLVLAVLLTFGCGKADESKSTDKPTTETKPVEPSAEQKKACGDAKQTAAAAWTKYSEAATKISAFQKSNELPKAEKTFEKKSKEKPYSNDKMFVDELKEQVEAAKRHVEALKASMASYQTASDVAVASAKAIGGATRDAKAASDRAAAGARDARDAAIKEVAAWFDENNDGPGRAIWSMKKAVKYSPNDDTKAELAKFEAEVGAMQKEVTQRHTDLFKLADAAGAASGKIDDTCKGIP